MITIKDIATMANVSKSTVSRALNNSGYVGGDARKRIEKIIKETGYAPSEHAKSLRTKKTKVIGVILPTIQTETPSRIVTGIGKELSKHGYQILLANTNLDIEREIEYLDLLRARQVDGIIFIATNTKPKLIDKVKELDVPIVMIGQEVEGVVHVTYDDYHAARDLTSYIVSKGHKRIAFIGVDETDRAVGYLRKKGFYDEMANNNLTVEDNWVQKAIFDIESGHDSMEKIMTSSTNLPTATFAVTDRLAIGAMNYLKKQGMRIPEDMGIASIGASEMSQYMDPPLTTMDYKNEEAGMQSAKQILHVINSEKVIKKITHGYGLIIRSSV